MLPRRGGICPAPVRKGRVRFLAWTTLSQGFSCGRRAAPRARQIAVEIRPERMVPCSQPGELLTRVPSSPLAALAS